MFLVEKVRFRFEYWLDSTQKIFIIATVPGKPINSEVILMCNLVKKLCGMTVLLAAINTPAALNPYSQDFEGLNQADPNALSSDGWLVFGNVFDSFNSYLYGYGSYGAPNYGGPAFSAIDLNQGGPDQGNQVLSIYNDYNNTDHGLGFLVEANVFQERTIDAGDVGKTYFLSFDAKLGNLSGGSTAVAFIKTLDPNSGYYQSSLLTFETTYLPVSWGTYGGPGSTLEITIDASLEGQLLQFGFASTATFYEGSGVFYDNINFAEVPEPTVFALAGLGAMLMTLRRRGRH